jgi:hypothetical protein
MSKSLKNNLQKIDIKWPYNESIYNKLHLKVTKEIHSNLIAVISIIKKNNLTTKIKTIKDELYE